MAVDADGLRRFRQAITKTLKIAGEAQIPEAVADFGDIEVARPRTATGRFLNARTREPFEPAPSSEDPTQPDAASRSNRPRYLN